MSDTFSFAKWAVNYDTLAILVPSLYDTDYALGNLLLRGHDKDTSAVLMATEGEVSNTKSLMGGDLGADLIPYEITAEAEEKLGSVSLVYVYNENKVKPIVSSVFIPSLRKTSSRYPATIVIFIDNFFSLGLYNDIHSKTLSDKGNTGAVLEFSVASISPSIRLENIQIEASHDQYEAYIRERNGMIESYRAASRGRQRDPNKAELDIYFLSGRTLNYLYPEEIRLIHESPGPRKTKAPADVDTSNGGWMSIDYVQGLQRTGQKLLRLLTDVFESKDEKQIIWTRYNNEGGVNLISTFLGYIGIRSITMTGSDNGAARRDIVRRFNEGEADVLVTNIKRKSDFRGIENVAYLRFLDGVRYYSEFVNIIRGVYFKGNYTEGSPDELLVRFYSSNFGQESLGDHILFEQLAVQYNKSAKLYSRLRDESLTINIRDGKAVVDDNRARVV